jgi:hypothetical protein
MIRRHKLIYLVVIFLALQLLILSHAKAEYRVYRLGVTYEPGQGETEVLTTLDDQQYETYYKITANQQTRLIDHWMCWGRTNDFQEYCDKPINPQARIPANTLKSQNQDQGQSDLPTPGKN